MLLPVGRSPEGSQSSPHPGSGVCVNQTAMDLWEGPEAQGSLPDASDIIQLKQADSSMCKDCFKNLLFGPQHLLVDLRAVWTH